MHLIKNNNNSVMNRKINGVINFFANSKNDSIIFITHPITYKYFNTDINEYIFGINGDVVEGFLKTLLGYKKLFISFDPKHPEQLTFTVNSAPFKSVMDLCLLPDLDKIKQKIIKTTEIMYIAMPILRFHDIFMYLCKKYPNMYYVEIECDVSKFIISCYNELARHKFTINNDDEYGIIIKKSDNSKHYNIKHKYHIKDINKMYNFCKDYNYVEILFVDIGVMILKYMTKNEEINIYHWPILT